MQFGITLYCKAVDSAPLVMRESHILNDCFPSEDLAVMQLAACRPKVQVRLQHSAILRGVHSANHVPIISQ